MSIYNYLQCSSSLRFCHFKLRMETWTTSLAARQFACNELPRLDLCFVHFILLLLFLVWAKWKCLSVRGKYLITIWRRASIQLDVATVLATAAAVAVSVSVCSLFAVSLKCSQFFSWHLGSTYNNNNDNNNCMTLLRNWHRRRRLPLVCLLFVCVYFWKSQAIFQLSSLLVFLCYLFCMRLPLPPFPLLTASLLVCPAIFLFFTLAFLLCFSFSLSLWHINAACNCRHCCRRLQL